MPKLSQLEADRKGRINRAGAVLGAASPRDRLLLNNPDVAALIEKMESAVEIGEATHDASYAAMIAATRERTDLRNDAARAERHAAEHHGPYEQMAEVARAKADKKDRQVEELTAKSKADTAAVNAMRRQLNESFRYFDQFDPDTVLKLVTNPKFSGDADKQPAISDATIADIEKLPPRAEDVEAALIAQLYEEADKAILRIGFGKRPTLIWPSVSIEAESDRDHPGHIPHAPDARGWAARFFKNELVADIKSAVAEHYRGKPKGMTSTEKAEAIAELRAKRLAADRVRCARIWDAYNSGKLPVLAFPADADIRAILMVEGPEPNRTSN